MNIDKCYIITCENRVNEDPNGFRWCLTPECHHLLCNSCFSELNYCQDHHSQDHHSKEVKLAAVNQDRWTAIKFINNPTEKLK